MRVYLLFPYTYVCVHVYILYIPICLYSFYSRTHTHTHVYVYTCMMSETSCNILQYAILYPLYAILYSTYAHTCILLVLICIYMAETSFFVLGKPISSSSGLPLGFDLDTRGMCIGEIRRVYLPPSLSYDATKQFPINDSGKLTTINRFQPLIIEVRLVSINGSTTGVSNSNSSITSI